MDALGPPSIPSFQDRVGIVVCFISDLPMRNKNAPEKTSALSPHRWGPGLGVYKKSPAARGINFLSATCQLLAMPLPSSPGQPPRSAI